MNNLKAALKRLLCTVFTKRCEICGEVIELDDVLCTDCMALKHIQSPRCMLCGYSKDDCICKKHKNEYKCIIAPYYYETGIIRAVHNFKDNDMPFLSERFSAEIADLINDCYSDIEFDYVTYVPLRKFKQLKRGFNQSELIAKNVADSIGVECKPILKKVRYTGIQHKKSAQQRSADIFGAYDVADSFKSKLVDKNILLIDDVKTTGSTLNECAKMLNIYGAGDVYAATFALVKKK